ncbi:acyl-CoA dehydrogenase family protein [Ignavigranum ruoffiae]|uniref:acyl-CoA dehydrogenase FadE n=1 Tax=Ignavigranum ruoffiae TaxID=89093 RepID=UPI0024ADE7CD|nr:acyl-CoA dehydrogenase family protein [Ignavigranum ruoffiae]
MQTKEELIKELWPEDLLGYAEKLTDKEVAILKNLQEQLEERLRPLIYDCTEKAELPREEILGVFRDCRIMDHPDLFEGRDQDWKPSEVYNVFLYLTLARFDPSVATFYTVHGGLGYNTILMGGNDEQRERFGRPVQRFEAQTCFGLTEPDHGSDIASGLASTAERKGDKWIINGEKRWIGGAKTADFIPFFARDVETGKIMCFMIGKDSPGLEVENVEHKIALRIVNNGHITCKNVQVDEKDRLEFIKGWKTVANIFVRTRLDVAHIALGTAAGSFIAAQKLVTTREQFGRKIGSFQLVQEKLARMQANVIAALGYSVRVAEIQETGKEVMLNSSLAKMHNALRMRETVALGREICGGNGITYDVDVARFFVDAEAIYTYEGTHEVNALIIGRELTNLAAFV